MFQSNSRIEKFKGLRFYEQDILMDDNIYSGDSQIVLNLDYLTPGIGLILMNYNKNLNEMYLFRIGYKESSVVYKLGDITKTMFVTSTILTTPVENMIVTFSKVGRVIKITHDTLGELLSYTLPNIMDKFYLGLYSNAGNIINSMSVATGIPDYWNINMKNTNGGHLKFVKNGFILNECKSYAEIEQSNIQLEAGTYFLRYIHDADSDIQCYVIKAGDDRLDDDEKNLLTGDKFVLKSPTNINVRFKGTHGSLSNIYISDRVGDAYMPTKDKQANIDGSYISINLKDITAVQWTGSVSAIPDNEPAYILMSDTQNIEFGVEGVLTNNSYTYLYTAANATLKISKGTNVVYTKQLSNVPDKITIFRNMDATITQFVITKDDGDTINLISEKTTIQYVPASITSPIVVLDEFSLPLDISSSYRVVDENGDDKYIFTNWEREVFTAKDHLKLEKLPSSVLGSVKVYGVLNDATVTEENLFRLKVKDLDSIGMYADKFEYIKEKDLHYIDKESGDIYIEDSTKYKIIVVDYLKKNTYCINYDSNSQMYSVDISSDSTNNSLLYDHSSSVSDGKTVTSINSYKTTNINPVSSNYIVLRREGF